MLYQLRDVDPDSNTKIGHNVFIGPSVILGKDCNLQGNVFIPDGWTLGNKVFVGPGTTFCNVMRPRIGQVRPQLKGYVGNHTTIGAGVTIRPGVHIGAYALIGAGTVVVHDVPNFAVVIGNPGSIKGFTCRCGAKTARRRPPKCPCMI